MDQQINQSRGRAVTRVISGDQFVRWRKERNLTIAQVSDLFGINRGSVKLLDTTGLTKTQALAIAAIDAGLKPWTPDEEG